MLSKIYLGQVTESKGHLRLNLNDRFWPEAAVQLILKSATRRRGLCKAWRGW